MTDESIEKLSSTNLSALPNPMVHTECQRPDALPVLGGKAPVGPVYKAPTLRSSSTPGRERPPRNFQEWAASASLMWTGCWDSWEWPELQWSPLSTSAVWSKHCAHLQLEVVREAGSHPPAPGSRVLCYRAGRHSELPVGLVCLCGNNDGPALAS